MVSSFLRCVMDILQIGNDIAASQRFYGNAGAEKPHPDQKKVEEEKLFDFKITVDKITDPLRLSVWEQRVLLRDNQWGSVRSDPDFQESQGDQQLPADRKYP